MNEKYFLKQFRYAIIFLMLLLNGFSNSANAQMVYVPDSNFRAALVSRGFGSCFVGDSIDSTCSAVTGCTILGFSDSTIKDITGIIAFQNLNHLQFWGTQVSFLPVLPQKITFLDCGENQITSIVSLPDSLRSFLVNNNQITSLPPLPSKLNFLECSHNKLTTLPALPDSLYSIYCNVNKLTILPALPDTLVYLNCSRNKIDSLPVLPNTLEFLWCEYNNLSELPALPNPLDNLRCGHNKLHYLNLKNGVYGISFVSCENNLLDSISSNAHVFYSLNCSHNNLTFLPDVRQVQKLICSYNQLPYLAPFLGHILEYLDCRNNYISSLPNLSSSLKILVCDSNLLDSIPNFPYYLTSLCCSNNQITYLPASLPQYVERFSCNNNLLTKLPKLNLGLDSLDCSNNKLTSLPDLHQQFLWLNCSNNLIVELPVLPKHLSLLDCSGNNSLSCFPKLVQIDSLKFLNTNVSCLPNYSQILFADPPLSNYSVCDFFNSSGCHIYWNIAGNIFFDSNLNCLRDSGDINIKQFKISLYKDGILDQEVFTDYSGYYSFFTDSIGYYQTTIDTINDPFKFLCFPGFFVGDTIHPTDSLVLQRDLPLTCRSGYDLVANDIYARGIVPGHLFTVNINAGDYADLFGTHCSSGISGIVQIVLDGPVSFVSAASGALSPTTVSGDTLIYNVPDFGAINFTTAFNFILSVDTTATIGSQVCISVAISPGSDNNPSNNFISECFTVRGSFDPNDKQVYPESTLDINGDRWLTYTVNFQNTGTAPAEHIYITDTLDSNLDLSTFQLLSCSHSSYVQILEGGIVKFNFPNINLIDSVADELHSHGYVQYKVKANDSIAVGSQINNMAYIYFDFNTPVQTNVVSNTIINCTQNVQAQNINICLGSEYNFNGLTLNQPGIYDQKFITASGCDSIVRVNLMIQPVTVITQLQDTLSASVNNASYQWLNCNSMSPIPSATAQTFNPLSSGSYAVIVSSGNCIDTSACYTISLTSIDQNFANQISVSPNPSSDEFVIYTPDNLSSKNISYKIYDAYGKVIEDKFITSNRTILKAENWTNGIYFMQINFDGKYSLRKLIKN